MLVRGPARDSSERDRSSSEQDQFVCISKETGEHEDEDEIVVGYSRKVSKVSKVSKVAQNNNIQTRVIKIKIK